MTVTGIYGVLTSHLVPTTTCWVKYNYFAHYLKGAVEAQRDVGILPRISHRYMEKLGFEFWHLILRCS